MREAPQIEFVDEDHCIATWQDVLISIWRRNPSAERLEKLRQFSQRFTRRSRTPISAIVVVEANCPVPDEAGRQHSIEFIRDLGNSGARGIVLVFEGSGFLAAASRAVMIGLMTGAHFAIPYKVVGTLTGAELFFTNIGANIGMGGTMERAINIARAHIIDQHAREQP
jgi:hypothetical protein